MIECRLYPRSPGIIDHRLLDSCSEIITDFQPLTIRELDIQESYHTTTTWLQSPSVAVCTPSCESAPSYPIWNGVSQEKQMPDCNSDYKINSSRDDTISCGLSSSDDIIKSHTSPKNTKYDENISEINYWCGDIKKPLAEQQNIVIQSSCSERLTEDVSVVLPQHERYQGRRSILFNDHFKNIDKSVQTLLHGFPSTTQSSPSHHATQQKEVITEISSYFPPSITFRGLSRGNLAQLHRKAWLEALDPHHRYGKNLRRYHKKWEKLERPTKAFFDWLDAKGEADGWSLPNLEECPRETLDGDTVRYISDPEARRRYRVEVVRCDDVRSASLDDGSSSSSSVCYISNNCGERIDTGEEGWIFVLRDGVMYAAPKIRETSGLEKQRFHHSSFFEGKAVAGAGIMITDKKGRLVKLYPHSGHYRPGEGHVQHMLHYFYSSGVDLRSFEVDVQQILRVGRKDNGQGKKVDSIHLMPAIDLSFYLEHKARMIGNGTFEQIHGIRT